MHLQAELVVGWNRRLRLRVQRAAPVFMTYLDFPTGVGRVHNKPTSLYIEVDVHMCNESAGVKSRIVYRFFFMAAAALETPIASARDASTLRQRRGMIPPRRPNTRSARIMSAPRF